MSRIPLPPFKSRHEKSNVACACALRFEFSLNASPPSCRSYGTSVHRKKGAALQDAKRGGKKLKLQGGTSSNKRGESFGGGGDDEAEGEGDGSGEGGEASPPPEGQQEQPVDSLRACVGEGRQVAFFQDSGAVPTKLEQEDLEVCRWFWFWFWFCFWFGFWIWF